MLYQLRPPADLHLDFPAQPSSAALARDAVRGVISLPRADLTDLLTIVSELVTNAVRHAGLAAENSLTLGLTWAENSIRVEVTDHGAGFDRATVEAEVPSSEGGFGLRIVAALSRAWGVVPDGGTVWADLAL